MYSRYFDEAHTAQDLLSEIQGQERTRRIETVAGNEVSLTKEGLVAIGDRATDCSADAVKDMAHLAQIPFGYFDGITPDLRCINVNHRLLPCLRKAKLTHVDIVWNDNQILRVQPHGLVQVPRSRILEVLLQTAPRDIDPNAIKAPVYALNGHVDLGLVSPSLLTQPRPRDDVFGGVHLTIEESGAIQVGPMTLRLVCSNGAMTRICAKGRHRLRRGNGPDSERVLLKAVAVLAEAAWQAWDQTQSGLRRLAEQPLTAEHIARLISRLTQRPFFLSVKVARKVQEKLLKGGSEGLTLFDLHNAVTEVGTHDDEVLDQYAYRLRLGAGSLTNREAPVCASCRQLVLA